MAIPELRACMDSIPGWLTYEEGETLYRLARGCTGRGVIVEIGSWRGKSTTCLGLGSRAGRGVRIYAVDRHTKRTFPRFQRTMKQTGLEDIVTPIRSRSQDAWRSFHEPIELLFIDGSHEYELVREDFDRWVPKVVDRGVVAMHDTTLFEGPKRVADELIFRSRSFKNARIVFGSTTVAVKVAENTRVDRLRNRYSLAVKRSVELVLKLVSKDRIPKRIQLVARRTIEAIQ